MPEIENQFRLVARLRLEMQIPQMPSHTCHGDAQTPGNHLILAPCAAQQQDVRLSRREPATTTQRGNCLSRQRRQAILSNQPAAASAPLTIGTNPGKNPANRYVQTLHAPN